MATSGCGPQGTSVCKCEDRTEWDRFRREVDQGIEPEPDADEEAFNGSTVRVVLPKPKSGVYMRLDDDILAFFKAGGRGYQARIIAVLHGYMEAQQTAAQEIGDNSADVRTVGSGL